MRAENEAGPAHRRSRSTRVTWSRSKPSPLRPLSRPHHHLRLLLRCRTEAAGAYDAPGDRGCPLLRRSAEHLTSRNPSVDP